MRINCARMHIHWNEITCTRNKNKSNVYSVSFSVWFAWIKHSAIFRRRLCRRRQRRQRESPTTTTTDDDDDDFFFFLFIFFLSVLSVSLPFVLSSWTIFNFLLVVSTLSLCIVSTYFHLILFRRRVQTGGHWAFESNILFTNVQFICFVFFFLLQEPRFQWSNRRFALRGVQMSNR